MPIINTGLPNADLISTATTLIPEAINLHSSPALTKTVLLIFSCLFTTGSAQNRLKPLTSISERG